MPSQDMYPFAHLSPSQDMHPLSHLIPSQDMHHPSHLTPSQDMHLLSHLTPSQDMHLFSHLTPSQDSPTIKSTRHFSSAVYTRGTLALEDSNGPAAERRWGPAEMLELPAEVC